MQPVTSLQRWPLHDVRATRRLEQALATTLPPHALMQRAGLAVARLALACAPHAQVIWIACGPGNNGGDGMVAARYLKQWGKTAVLSWLGSTENAPTDALDAHQQARQAGVLCTDAPPDHFDLCVDALLGIGIRSGKLPRPANPRLSHWIAQINQRSAPVLAVDLPSGLQADTGQANADTVRATTTLSLLTLKPGLFTADGRDVCGQVWLDDLGLSGAGAGQAERIDTPTAWLLGAAPAKPRLHASHKGSYGDVTVIAGAAGMTGAALLAAAGALSGGAGRVLVGLLDGGSMTVDPTQPELMFRNVDTLALADSTVVCGCGGGEAIHEHLAKILSVAGQAVLDADALNSIARDTSLQGLLRARSNRQRASVLTPHPLEAARLLGRSSAEVQRDRIAAAQQLCERFGCTVVLKGSGTVIASPGEVPAVNPSGNARLATAGTGDVLAGMVGAELAKGQPTFAAACSAVHRHGALADQWCATVPLTASALSRH